MSDQQQTPDEYQQLHEAARKIVEESQDIQAEVRKLTLEALGKGNLEKDRIKAVVQSVLEGAQVGSQEKGENLKSALSQAVNGLDEALVKTASATKLAIQEAAGHVKEYTQHDIKRALDDLEGLETTFIDVIKDVANSSTELASRILNDLASHAKNSGTAVGKKSSESLATLRDQLKQLGKESFMAGADAAKSVSVRIARASSGFLAGLADTIEGGHRKDTPADETSADTTSEDKPR